MENRFKISVVIPVYNVEEYLRDAIDSVLNQSIGFKKNIQLILVNDGSTDNSGEICREYKARFGDNIIFIDKENGGVSSARNAGIDCAEGKYVTFLDSDDKWEESSFENAFSFFEKHYDEIDVLAAKIMFFEATEKPHSLNKKFGEGSRIADLTDENEFSSIQSTAATTLIKREAIGDLRFDSRLKYGEDATFINKIMLKKCAYGLINEAIYFYRRRANGTSAVDSQTLDKRFYIDSLKYYHLELINYSKELYGEVVPFIQAIVAHDVCWRFANPDMKTVLNEEEQKEYFALLKEILNQVDDEFLLKNRVQRQMAKKYDAMYYKYGIDIYENLTLNLEEGALCFNDISIFNVSRNKTKCFQVERVYIENKRLIIEALAAKWLFKVGKSGSKLIFKINKEEIPSTITDYKVTKAKTSDGLIDYYNYCRVEYSLEKLKRNKSLTFKPFLVVGDEECSLSLNYGKYVANNNAFNTVYKFYGNYAIKCFRTNIKIYYPENKARTRLKWNLKMISYLFKEKRFDVIVNRFIRLPLFKKTHKEKLWIVSDRIDNAGDNGEVFFKYLCAHKPEGVRPVFMIGENAGEDVKARLKSIGEVIYAENKKYPLFFLAADKIISSGAGEFTINALETDRKFYTDLYSFDFYYLQHGVACADLSAWLNRMNKNIHRFFTSGERETQSIINGNYGYGEENVVLTGQARFDALYEDTKKQILILPTWRRSIKQAYDNKTSSVYFEGFKDTDYFKFYNGLINDERLLSAMKKAGYKGIFCLHPIFMKQFPDFEANDVFSINEGYIDYNKVFAESAVMVTDYSSVLFDFAYLRKPVIYAQFDKEQFFEDQIYDEGYFSYENDGFGPVCYDFDKTVEELIKLVENDCKEPEKYRQRVDSFFAFNDKNNSERIYNAIVNE